MKRLIHVGQPLRSVGPDSTIHYYTLNYSNSRFPNMISDDSRICAGERQGSTVTQCAVGQDVGGALNPQTLYIDLHPENPNPKDVSTLMALAHHPSPLPTCSTVAPARRRSSFVGLCTSRQRQLELLLPTFRDTADNIDGRFNRSTGLSQHAIKHRFMQYKHDEDRHLGLAT